VELVGRETSGNLAESSEFHATLGIFYMRQIYEGSRAEDFFALKNPTASAGFETANLGTKGQHATPRPSKPLWYTKLQLRSESLNRLGGKINYRKKNCCIFIHMNTFPENNQSVYTEKDG
jgi:hypothetical protein